MEDRSAQKNGLVISRFHLLIDLYVRDYAQWKENESHIVRRWIQEFKGEQNFEGWTCGSQDGFPVHTDARNKVLKASIMASMRRPLKIHVQVRPFRQPTATPEFPQIRLDRLRKLLTPPYNFTVIQLTSNSDLWASIARGLTSWSKQKTAAYVWKCRFRIELHLSTRPMKVMPQIPLLSLAPSKVLRRLTFHVEKYFEEWCWDYQGKIFWYSFTSSSASKTAPDFCPTSEQFCCWTSSTSTAVAPGSRIQWWQKSEVAHHDARRKELELSIINSKETVQTQSAKVGGVTEELVSHADMEGDSGANEVRMAELQDQFPAIEWERHQTPNMPGFKHICHSRRHFIDKGAERSPLLWFWLRRFWINDQPARSKNFTIFIPRWSCKITFDGNPYYVPMQYTG